MANRVILPGRLPSSQGSEFERINIVENGDGTVSLYFTGNDGTYPSNPAAITPTGEQLRALLLGNLPASQGGVAVLDTLGQGYIVAPGVVGFTSSASLNPLAAINQVRFVQLVVPFKSVISRIVTEVTGAGGAGTRYGMGLYSGAGAKLLETGALAADALGVNTTVLGAPITINPGVYFHAYTADSTTALFRSFSTPAGMNGLLNAVAVRLGQAANAGVAGVLPATLGALTINSHNPPYAIYEP